MEKVTDSKTGGSALARLILDPSLNNVRGKYFDQLEEIQSSEESYDARKSAELWKASMELVKLLPQAANVLD